MTQNKPFDMAKTAGGEVPLPYDNRFTADMSGADMMGNPSVDPMVPAEIFYRKREGGVYVYSNNPEMLRNEDADKAILKTRGLTGDVEFTYEHSNHTDKPLYFGYRLQNDGESDVEVLVTNVGMQVDGEWLGQRSWSDFYNIAFSLPEYYFVDGKESPAYRGQDFLDYTPRVFTPASYRIPAGQYIYVLGGTTADAYAHTDVGGTADQPVLRGKCSNGAVKFRVSGGEVTGTFFVYTDPAAIAGDPPEQGYIVRRNGIDFFEQYKGLDPSLGLIEAEIAWTVNDKTPSGPLPVTYTSSYDEHISEYPETPYMAYHSTPHRVLRNDWLTALNPQNAHGAVGTDMMIFRGIREDGTPIVIDNEHADGGGKPSNTGNWMVQYNNNFTFINQGNRERTFKVYTDGALSGALLVLVRNEEGDVLDARCTIAAICYPASRLPEDADPRQYEEYGGMCYPYLPNGMSYRLYKPRQALMASVTVPPHSYRRITVDYNILGNSMGGALNRVELE